MVSSLLSSKALQLRSNYLTQLAYQRAMSSRRTAVVVGATSGIGEACAFRLAEQGFLVVAVGRDRPGRAEAMVEKLMEKSVGINHDSGSTNNNSNSNHQQRTSPPHEFYACDAFSLSSIQETAQKIQAKHPKIDTLVMTQGMATTQGFTPTNEGNDEKLTLHYYSRMGMIQSLLPALTKSDMPAVVVSVLSGGVHSVYQKYQDDPTLKQTYSIKNAADAAGYYNDLGLDQFALDHSEIKFVHAAPGFVNTNWGSEFHPILRGIVRFMQPFGKSAADCAEMLMGATVLAVEAGESLPELPKRNENDDPSSEGGVYIIGQHGKTAALTKDHSPGARASIWKHTKEVLRKAGIAID